MTSLLLSSFGFSSRDPKSLALNTYFQNVPPVRLDYMGPEFLPDYPVFLLFDEYIIDGASLESLRDRSYFSRYAELLDALNAEGRLRVIDFTTVIADHGDAIEKAVGYDVRNIDMWTDAFEELTGIWQSFCWIGKCFLSSPDRSAEMTDEDSQVAEILREWQNGMLPGDERVIDILRSWRRQLPGDQRDLARRVVGEYLRHVVSTMCLADILDTAVYDWDDIRPLYWQKLRLRVDPNDHGMEETQKVRQLIDLIFPHLRPSSGREFAHVLADKRIEQLRTLVRSSVKSGEAFDHQFATNLLNDLLKAEQKGHSLRRIAGFLTTPLSLMPLVGTAAQLVADQYIQKRIEIETQKKTGWLFLLSGIGRE